MTAARKYSGWLAAFAFCAVNASAGWGCAQTRPAATAEPTPVHLPSTEMAEQAERVPAGIVPGLPHSVVDGELSTGPIAPIPPAAEEAIHARRANGSSTGQGWLSPYLERAQSTPDRAALRGEPIKLAGEYAPWWDTDVRRPLSHNAAHLNIGVGAINDGALRHASYVHVVSTAPQIRTQEFVQRLADFDWRAFLDTAYNDSNEPVGSTLIGTNDDRFKDRRFSLNAGLRRRTSSGAEFELAQRMGYQDNNSRFLVPNAQRTTRLELQFTQPLLRGGGRVYNQSQIVLARIDVSHSKDDVVGLLETHLVQVTEAYWELYRTRAVLLQRRRLLAAAENILQNLAARRAVDAVERQVLRAQTAVAKRKSELIRFGADIRNTESQLRLLVNDPLLVASAHQEFIPIDSPLAARITPNMAESLRTALLNRPDVSQAIRDVQRVAVQLGVARQDVLPRLDLVANTYVAGLANQSDGGQAFINQFADGRPSYSFGLQLDVPLGNRFAQARAQQRQLEMRRAMKQFQLTVEESLTEVEMAVRETDTSYRELAATFEALNAASRETAYLDDRWRLLPSADGSAAQLLENLLDAQERVADEEQALVAAQVGYAMSLVRLKREMGTLLRASPN